jgi:hypothetical protein
MALIITIIVLLLLAGVSISAIIGEDGIITKAVYAKQQAKIAEYKEKISFAASKAILDSDEPENEDKSLLEIIKEALIKNDSFSEENLNIEIDEDTNKENLKVIINDSNVLDDSYVYEVIEKDDGTVEINYIGKVGEIVASASYTPTYWTNGVVTVTLPIENGFTTVYTTDGTTPTASSTEYDSTNKLTVSSNCTVKYAYKDSIGYLGTEGSKSITNIDTILPTIDTQLVSTAKTTNSMTMSIKATDSNSGFSKVIWYYKLSTEGEDKYKHETDEDVAVNSTSTKGEKTAVTKTRKFSNLTKGTYNVYAEVYDIAGNMTRSPSTGTVDVTLDTVTAASSSASCSPTYWTNGSVTVTLPTESGFTTVYTTDGSIPTTSSTVYNSNNKITVNSNCTIKYAYSDGVNLGTAGSKAITNIDKTVPTINTQLASTEKTTNSMTMSIKVTDSNSGFSKVIWYYKLSSASSYTSATDEAVAVNSTSTAGEKNEVTKTRKFSNLTKGTYNVYAEVYDIAGNMTRSPSTGTVNVTLDTVTAAGSLSYDPAYWTTGAVTVTLPTENGFATVYTTDGSIPTVNSTVYDSNNKITVSNNCTIKYAYSDGINLGTAGSKAISNIDKTAPDSFTIEKSSVGANSFTLSATFSDSNSGLGKIIWYYKRPQDSSWQSSSVVYTQLNGTTAGITGSITNTFSVTGLSKGGTIKAYAIGYDVAGNSLTTTNATSSNPLSFNTGTYTISYNMNGGTGTIASQSKYYGVDITLSSTEPTKSGYKFLGWSTNSSATSATYTAGGTYSANSSNTLYAVWQTSSVTITYSYSWSRVSYTASKDQWTNVNTFNYTSPSQGTVPEGYNTATLVSITKISSSYSFINFGSVRFSASNSAGDKLSVTPGSEVTLNRVWYSTEGVTDGSITATVTYTSE